MDGEGLLGRRVLIHGLVSKPELNGESGRVMSIDATSGRCAVRLEGKQGERISIRPANLEATVEQRLPSARVGMRLPSADDDRMQHVKTLPEDMPACRCLLDHPEHPPPPLPLASSKHDSVSLVSVLSPTTYERRWCHESLYRCFKHQSYPRKELIVLDTGAHPSPFFSRRATGLPEAVASRYSLRRAARRDVQGDRRGRERRHRLQRAVWARPQPWRRADN